MISTITLSISGSSDHPRHNSAYHEIFGYLMVEKELLANKIDGQTIKVEETRKDIGVN